MMVAFDTNVWARAYLNDDEEQTRKARAAIHTGRLQHGGVFVPLIVLAELFWVLRTVWEKDMALRSLEDLLATDGVVIESHTLVAKALEAASKSATGFADLLIAHVAFSHGATEIITFDKVFGRLPKVRRLI